MINLIDSFYLYCLFFLFPNGSLGFLWDFLLYSNTLIIFFIRQPLHIHNNNCCSEADF